MATLIDVKMEPNPNNTDAVAWFAYFEGTPSEEELEGAFRSIYQVDEKPKVTSTPEINAIGDALDDQDTFNPRYSQESGYDPGQFQDKVADRARLERWFLCQAI